MKNKNNIIKNIVKIIISLFILAIIAVLGIFIYDRATVNNKYSINNENIDIPIWVYHDIVDNESQIKYDYMQTTKDTFENQIVGLRNLGYKFITYEDLKKFKNNEIELNKKSCILTFDDGYKGVYKNVFPIAKKYNIPFTAFIITKNMGNTGVFTWEEAKEMQDSGLVTIASHSIDHPEFTKLTTEEAVKNVNDSYKIIEEKLGEQKTKVFTYPYGLYTEEQINQLEKEEYIQNLTDNKINKSKKLDLSRLHRSYPLSDSIFKMILKKNYRSFRYN